MNRRTGSLVSAILGIASLPAGAQWLNVPTKGIPRTKDGKPDLAAPAPRKPDGKPDLSGIWQMDRGIGIKYGRNLLADFKPGELSIPGRRASLGNLGTGDHASDYPGAHCLPQGIPILIATSGLFPLKIVQEPDLVVILYETFSQFRQIFLDGRTLAKDPNPTWLGYSVGRWDGDILVVDSTGFNGKTWLDEEEGHPTTEALHVTERYRRLDFGHLDLRLTIDDPKAYTKPWTVAESMHIFPDTELLEYICNENEKDLKHTVDK